MHLPCSGSVSDSGGVRGASLEIFWVLRSKSASSRSCSGWHRVSRARIMERTAMITALRHAPPVRTGLCAGRFELPVMEIGAALDSLTRELHEREIRSIYGSPSLRCANLATLLARRLGLPVQLDERL